MLDGVSPKSNVQPTAVSTRITLFCLPGLYLRRPTRRNVERRDAGKIGPCAERLARLRRRRGYTCRRMRARRAGVAGRPAGPRFRRRTVFFVVAPRPGFFSTRRALLSSAVDDPERSVGPEMSSSPPFADRSSSLFADTLPFVETSSFIRSAPPPGNVMVWFASRRLRANDLARVKRDISIGYRHVCLLFTYTRYLL